MPGLLTKRIRQFADRLATGWRWAIARRRPTGCADEAGAMQVEVIRGLVAGEACARVRLALTQRDAAAAGEALQRLNGLQPNHPDLPEFGAVLALLAGAPRRALRILDAAPPANPRLRLLRHLLQLQTGRRDLAHMELSAWTREANCPTRARLLAAWLDWQRGQIDRARDRLQSNRQLTDDPQSERLQLLIELTQGMPHTARRCSDRLAGRLGLHAPTARFCRSLEIGESADATISPDLVAALAERLREHVHLIPTLVAAQQASPRPIRIELLRRALMRIVETVPEPQSVIEGLTELANLSGDRHDVARWAIRGLRHPPYSARLALLLDRATESTQPTGQISVASVLRELAQEHPDWPDVQRALVLRLHRSGRTALAQHHLRQWMAQSSDCELARRTHAELAA